MARPACASMESALNRKNLVVFPLDRSTPKQTIWQELLRICPTHDGVVVVSHDSQGQGNKGEAFLNFFTKAGASACLDSHRFTLTVRGKPVRLTYVANFVDRSLFTVLVKNLTDEVEADVVYEKVYKMGEIFDIRVEPDHFGQIYATVQYVEESSVHRAVKELNNTSLPGYNIMISVIYHPKRQFFSAQRAAVQHSPAPVAAAPPPAPVRYAAPPAAPVQQYGAGFGDAYGAGASGSGRASASGGASTSAPAAPTQYAIPTPYPAAPDTQQAACADSWDPVPSQSGGGGSAVPLAGGGGGAVSQRQGLQDALQVALKRMSFMNDLMCCPITQEVFRDPVVAQDGVTYERAAIENWLLSHDTSPMSNEPLQSKTLVANKLVANLIHDVL